MQISDYLVSPLPNGGGLQGGGDAMGALSMSPVGMGGGADPWAWLFSLLGQHGIMPAGMAGGPPGGGFADRFAPAMTAPGAGGNPALANALTARGPQSPLLGGFAEATPQVQGPNMFKSAPDAISALLGGGGAGGALGGLGGLGGR